MIFKKRRNCIRFGGYSRFSFLDLNCVYMYACEYGYALVSAVSVKDVGSSGVAGGCELCVKNTGD